MDIISYLIGLLTGKKQATGTVIFEGNGFTFSDPNNDGHITVTRNEEANDNG